MQEETDMLKIVEEAEANSGRSAGVKLVRKPTGSAVAINEEQAAAIEQILRSRGTLATAVRGVAGSGKTTMLDRADNRQRAWRQFLTDLGCCREG
jgi:hypothetical protein